MKKNKLTAIGVILIVAAGASCDDILEHDLRDEVVKLEAPVDSLVTSEKQISFWWEPMDGASNYTLRIVSKSDPSSVLQLDTTILKTTFTFALDTGLYDWCIRASNSGYTTGFSCRRLKIIE